MPKPRIDGTHRPIKMAESCSPLNHKNSANTRERKAESSNRKSVMVNFLNIGEKFELYKLMRRQQRKKELLSAMRAVF
jgi:hypothetical protein